MEVEDDEWEEEICMECEDMSLDDKIRILLEFVGFKNETQF